MVVAGLLLSVVVLSIKSGLILGASWLSLRATCFIAAGFGAGVVLLSLVFRDNYMPVVHLIDRNTFGFACIAGVLLIYLGTHRPPRAGVAAGKIDFKHWAGFIPCPLCAGALTVSVIYSAGRLNRDIMHVALMAGILFAFCTFMAAWLTRVLLTWLKRDVAGAYQQVLLFLGFFTLISAFLIPNIVKVMNMEYAMPVAVSSLQDLGVAALGFSIVFIAGFIKSVLERRFYTGRKR